MSTEPKPESPAVDVAPVVPAAEGAKPDEPLGAPGIKALESERALRAEAEKSAAALAARIKEFEDRDKTEAQKQADALAEAQAQLAELTIAKTRAEVAAAKGVPAGLLSGSTQAELEAAADALIAFKGTAPKGPVIPDQGRSPTGGAASPAQEFAEFISQQRT